MTNIPVTVNVLVVLLMIGLAKISLKLLDEV